MLVKSVPLKSALQPTTYCTPLVSVARMPLSSGHLPTPVPTGAVPEEVIDARLEVVTAAKLVALASEVDLGGNCVAVDTSAGVLDAALLAEEEMLDVREDSNDDTAEEMLELIEDILEDTALGEALESADDKLEASLEVLEA